ncbi:MAG: type II toxin-antitoxin system YafQ family toxin [Muribaculaceae bacterium]|nr:type II toxin-antitoxin system YafQ family toxin [Muribaculaceae bacterium]
MIIRLTSQFKKDLKRYKNNARIIDKLEHIINLLSKGQQVPSIYKPHKLKGDYLNHMECHIENDVLLIWLDKVKGTIYLVRLGTHSEVF